MDRTQLESTFHQQAATYDQQWAKLAAFRDGLHLLIASIFSKLPHDARILCVGAGTGAEIHFLAARHPDWTFVAVEPAAGMVRAAELRAEQHGYRDRGTFQTGYLDSLPDSPPFDAATSLLVSQFIFNRTERTAFFQAIADRLKPDGWLATSDLAADRNSESYASLLGVWLQTTAAAELSPQRLQQMREGYDRDVSILPLRHVRSIIAAGGFKEPVQFFQAGLIHAWYARRS